MKGQLAFILVAFASACSLGIVSAQNVSATAGYAYQGSTIAMEGYTFINYNNYGRNYVTATTDFDYGDYLYLKYNSAYYTSFFTGASCAYVDFTSNYSTVTAFLVTKENLISMKASGTLDYTNYKQLSLFYWEGKTAGSYLFNVNSTQKYGFVVVNTGGQIIENGVNRQASTDLGVNLEVYDSQSSTCAQAKQPSGLMTSNAAARSNSNLLPYIEVSDSISPNTHVPYITLDSLSCVSVQLPAQPPSNTNPVDLTLGVLPLNSYVDWFNKGRTTGIPWIGYAISQNSNSTTSSTPTQSGSPTTTAGSNVKVSKNQAGQSNIDNLDPKLTYLLVIWNGLSTPSQKGSATNVLLRYMVKTSGSCASNQFQDGSNQYLSWGNGSSSSPSSPGSPQTSPTGSPQTSPSTPGINIVNNTPGPSTVNAIPPGPVVIPSPPKNAPGVTPAGAPPSQNATNPPLPAQTPPAPTPPAATPASTPAATPATTTAPISPLGPGSSQGLNGTSGPAAAPGGSTTTGLDTAQSLVGKSCSAPGPQSSAQILNSQRGVSASISSYPYIVSLRSSQANGARPGQPAHYCGGTVLFDRIVVTAAHCCSSKPDPGIPWAPNYTTPTGTPIRDPPVAVLGTDCSSGPGVQEQAISYVIVHPLWNGDYKNGYDICVMVTAKPFDKDKIQGRTLTLTNSTAYQKDQSVVGRVQSAGWGISGLGSGPSPVLKDLNMSIVGSTDIASAILKSEDTQLYSNQVMTTSADGSTCSGDSGGPLVYSPSNHQTPTTDVLLGVVSYGKSSCQANTWSIFSDVSSFSSLPNGNCADLTNYKVGSADRYDAFLPCVIQTVDPRYDFSGIISTQDKFFVPDSA